MAAEMEFIFLLTLMILNIIYWSVDELKNDKL